MRKSIQKYSSEIILYKWNELFQKTIEKSLEPFDFEPADRVQ